MLSLEKFTEQLVELSDEYRRDNAWVNKWAHWDNDEIMAKFISCAYNLYSATASNRLKLTLLGGTEIRLDDQYIRNFGVTGTNGIQDEDTRFYVRRERERRLKTMLYPSPKASNPVSYTPVITTGSILSEKSWTPILNDALIIGAVTAGQDFALALTPIEQKDWEDMNKETDAKSKPHMMQGGGAKNKFLADKFGQSKAVWKKFLNSQRRIFIDCRTGAPRVFTREMLGLYFAGYKPEFSSNQLGFSAQGRKQLDFKTYLRNLRSVGFHLGKPSEKKVMETISKFFFEDETAIGSPWPVGTKIQDDTYPEYYH